MLFCERCGRYLEDGDVICPECGYAVKHEVSGDASNSTHEETKSSFEGASINGVSFDMFKDMFGKYFYASMIIMAVVSFSVTYFWRFTILLFCVPILMPSRKGIGLGMMIGAIIGCLSGWLLRSGFFFI